ncbi:MAG: TlpA family protein disulfide reductase [Blastocatellia bacterium]|nr:TlpA family protein disulfide reductase [Blastocatellia bacterium]MDW8168915.1 TlpA disulfide reductase family protein [Acidobacteriota bacterium]MDW8256675.1 TlpA disulfide reductase family protein [Acidobacteriota bacterium]
MNMAAAEGTSKRSTSARWTALLVIAGMGAAWAAYAIFFRSGARPSTAVIDGLPWAPDSHRRAPDFRIRTLDGREIVLSDFRGKVLIVDFWATWCPPCRDEVPLLVELKNAYGDRGLEILGLTIEDPERDVPQVQRFVREFGVNYPIGFAPDGMFEAFVGPGEHPIPQTFLFDREGKLREHLVGFNPLTDARRLRRVIARILHE